jgi:DnaJ-class molecular chaperone
VSPRAPAPNTNEGEPEACRPCRGTGKVVSALGGERTEVTCPWCEGSGRWLADHDAQARAGPAEGGESQPAS